MEIKLLQEVLFIKRAVLTIFAILPPPLPIVLGNFSFLVELEYDKLACSYIVLSKQVQGFSSHLSKCFSFSPGSLYYTLHENYINKKV